jgi:YbbR domain-containing protein
VRTAVRWIASNVALMVLALVLASLAWIVAVEQEDPTLEGGYTQTIPVVLSEPPEGMVLVGEFDEQVQVTVRAPTSVWSTLEVDDFTVTADMEGLEAGIHKVPVEVTLDKPPSRVVLVEPQYVTLELEPEAERTVPIRVQVKGEPPLGYLMRTPIVMPSQVTISGPSTYVAQVVEAVTQVSVQDADAEVEGEFRLQPQDSEGQPVPYVTLAVDKVNVRVPIELSVYYRPLAIKVILEGRLASGYRITEVSVEPPSVTVFGVPDVTAALPGFIETEPINVEGAQADVVARPALSVPPNVSIIMDEQPVVQVSIEAIQSSITVVITPTIQSMEPGFTATVSPDTVEVILSGPLPLLDSLEANDVRIVLDLFRLPQGTHQIEPQMVVPEGVIAQSVNPATVQVEILPGPTPTSTED